MEYKIFRLKFNAGVHIGEGSLEDSGISLRADTIFSALCIEALKSKGQELLEQLVSLVRTDALLISDAFPFIGNEYYIPKPIFAIRKESDDHSAKKTFKKLKYIPLDMLPDYIAGDFDKNTAQYITGKLDNLGKSAIVMRAAVRREEDTLPYQVGMFTFQKDSALYIIAGGNEKSLSLLRELLTCVANAGIGGKRSSGLGKFYYQEESVDEEIRFFGEESVYVTLSVSLPDANEMEKALEGATYSLIRRSGFVFSETYSDEPVRKNDLYVLDSGSVVRHKFCGNVYDVSNKGNHPVYRYAKPLLLGVEICT